MKLRISVLYFFLDFKVGRCNRDIKLDRKGKHYASIDLLIINQLISLDKNILCMKNRV